MNHDFRQLKALVINGYRPTQTMQVTCLKLLGFKSVSASTDSTNAYASFKKENFDVVIGEAIDGRTDGVGFAKKARESVDSPNEKVPVVCVAGPQAARFKDQAKDIGLIEFLAVPYSIEDIANRVAFVLRRDFSDGYVSKKAKPIAAPVAEIEPIKPTAEEKKSHDVSALLLDHYMKHHEVVLKKLHFAKDATDLCLSQLKETADKLKAEDKKNISLKEEFEKMWSEILEQFVEGGVSEEDLIKIEGVIETIPSDIKAHYDNLSSKDQEFLDLVESMNVSAYKSAKALAHKAQSEPNILSGMTADDYKSGNKAASPQVKETKDQPKDPGDTVKQTADWRFIKR